MVYEGGQGEIIEKKSRFIANVRPVETEEEAVAFINEMKKQYWDARHNCSAFVLGERQEMTRCSDDGEPAQTAGRPMLDVLLKEGITNVAVVVTRYFGGVLLGTGGLVRAYSHTSKIAVESGNIITMAQCSIMSVGVDYSFYERLNVLLSSHNANIINTDFADNVTVTFSVKEDGVEKLREKLIDISNGKYDIKYIESRFAKL